MNRFGFCAETFGMFSKFFLGVKSKNCGRNSFLIFFSDFFRILTENFSDFWPNLQKVVKTTFCVSTGLWNFFFKFWIVSDFLQKPLAWFSKFYLRVQIKNCGKNSFFCFLFRIFSIFEQNFFRSAKKLQKVLKTTFYVSRGTVCGLKFFSKVLNRFGFSAETFGMVLKFLSTCFGQFFKKLWKLSSACPQEQLVASKFFKTIWTVLDFLQKPLACFSNFYLRVQSKNCGRNSFLIFLFTVFSDFERKIFQTFGEKSSKSCQNYLLRVQRNNLWLEIFFKSFESFWIFCRNFWHGSQISIYVSRVKIAEETVFWFFFSEFFRILSEKFFRLLAEKRQEFVKTAFYVSRGTICGLNF